MRKILLIVGLAGLVVLQAAVAWNARLCWQAKALARTPEEKIRLLRLAEAVFPWNGAVPFELGKVYFERGAESLGDPAARNDLFRKAIDGYLRSLRFNPGSPAAHFELGQALLYAGYSGLTTPLTYFDEYKRAAELTGHNGQIRYDAGKVLLGRWVDLGPDERDFVAGLLKSSIAGKGEERLLDLLEAWNLAGRDAGLMDRVLPEDPDALRTYARYLGERSLSLESRHAALARAEALDVAWAKAEVERARDAAGSFRITEASHRAAAALDTLGSVKFYQALAAREFFDPREYQELCTAARRLLAMGLIEETRSLDDPDGTIAAYLEAEDDPAALGEFETFLRERGLLNESRADAPFKSLKTLAFRMGLDFKLARFRDIARVEGLLATGSTVLAPSGRASYVRILRLIGEANLALDRADEAQAFLEKARDVDPDSLDVLLGLERCYSLQRDEAKAAEARLAIGKLVSSDTIELNGRTVAKGRASWIDLITTGGPRTFRLEFAPTGPDTRPLFSVFLDGRVVWEKYGDTGPVEFSGTLVRGPARIEVRTVSAPVSLGRLSMIPAGRH